MDHRADWLPDQAIQYDENRPRPHRRDAEDDPTRFFRGLAIGVAASLPLWALIILCWNEI